MGFFSNLFAKKKPPAAPVPEPIPPELDNILRDYAKETSLPCITFTPKSGGATIFSCKFGGSPYLPPDFEYPCFQKDNGESKPLRLLAQLNFEELPRLPDFPDKGILQFYIADGYDDVLGLDFDNPTSGKGFRVIYHENVIRDESALQAPPDFEDDEFPIQGEYTLDAKLSELPMNSNDFRFDEQFMEVYKRYIPTEKRFVNLPGSYSDKIYDFLGGWGHHIGGYPAFTQSDPRDAGGWEDYTILLLQIDSDSKDNSIMWGDCGVANFFISPECLKNRDFSNVLYNWDCY